MTTSRLAVAVLLASAIATGATDLVPVPRPPILLRLDGTVAPNVEAARKRSIAAVVLRFPGRHGGASPRRWLAVENARTVGADSALDGKDVLAQIAPLGSQLFTMGPDALTDQVLPAPPGTRLRLEGLVNIGSGTYYLRLVRVGPDAWDDAR